MTARGQLMRAWRVIGEKRNASVHRRMRDKPMTLNGVVRQTERDGYAWLEDLSNDYGPGTVEDIIHLAEEVDAITGPNLVALLFAGVLTPRQLAQACIAAGFASGYFVRAELDRQEQES